MSLADWVAASAVVALGASLHGSVGFGMSLLSTPLLVLVDPRLVPAPVICVSALLTVLILLRERQAVDLKGLPWALVGALPGVWLGGSAVGALPTRGLSIVIALLILTAVGVITVGRPPRRSPLTMGVTGTVSGFMGTAAGIGGPPIALIYRNERGPTIRASISGFFLVLTPLQLVSLTAVGRLGAWELGAAAALAPGMCLGFLMSSRVRAQVDAGLIRVVILIVSTVSAGAVLLRALL